MRVGKVLDLFFAAGVVRLRDKAVQDFVERVRGSVDDAQVFDADSVLDWDVFDAALVNAVLAIRAGRQRARTLSNEVLIRLAATTQISEAIEKVGLNPGCDRAVFLVLGGSLEQVKEEAATVLSLAEGGEIDLPKNPNPTRFAELYGISDKIYKSVQAKTSTEALKLAIMQKIASTLI
ncbi:MAG: KEOPS complex subunit Cgi121 [Candidatus Caldarchaeum sp.]